MEKGPRVGDLVDRYFALRREISLTNHSHVFEAVQEHTGRACVIKLLTPAMRSDPKSVGRLLREARILDAARGAAVPDVICAGTCPAYGPYVAMELLKGRSLEGLLVARHMLGTQDTVQLAYALCDVLGDVHAAGITHRDLAPANVWLAPVPRGDRVMLIDFDTASLRDAAHASPRLTGHGEQLGTPRYMSPEQLLGRIDDVAERSDVYGLAATLFECLTGEPPYPGGAMPAMLANAKRAPPPLPHEREPGVPRALSEAVGAALSRDPHDRPATPGAFAASIGQATGLLPGAVRLLSAAEHADGPQRRMHTRIPYVTSVRIIARGRAIDGHSEDLSEGGLLFVSRERLPEAPELTARFALPSSGRIVDVPVAARWTRERRGHFAIGLEFLELSAKHKGEVALFALLSTAGEAARGRPGRPSGSA